MTGMEMVHVIGQEWCLLPAQVPVPPGWLVAQTSAGTVVLCLVEEIHTGRPGKQVVTKRRRPVKAAELNPVDVHAIETANVHEYEVPVQLISTANQRERWRTRHTRMKTHRRTAYLTTPPGVKVPCTVHIVRVAPGRPMDDDNLANSAKGVRDGIADRLKVDDGSPLVAWTYGQVKGKRGKETTMVTITEIAGADDAEA